MTVARPDLVDTAAASITRRASQSPGHHVPGRRTRCGTPGPAPSGASTTRYYLSLDGVKNARRHAADRQPGACPAWRTGRASPGTVTVTIPATTPLNTYFLLACADDLDAVAESNEGNNCSVAVTGDGDGDAARPGARITVSTTPAAPVRAPRHHASR